MKVALIVFLVLGSLVHTSHGTFDQFMASIPTKIGNAITSAWHTILDAIKKPVRMKKLGPGAKHKVKTRAKAVTVDPSIWQSTEATRTSLRLQDLFRRANTDSIDKERMEDTFRVTLPHLSLPRENSLDGRYKFRVKDYEHEKHNMKGKYNFPGYYTKAVTERNVEDPDENYFGHLIFV